MTMFDYDGGRGSKFPKFSPRGIWMPQRKISISFRDYYISGIDLLSPTVHKEYSIRSIECISIDQLKWGFYCYFIKVCFYKLSCS